MNDKVNTKGQAKRKMEENDQNISEKNEDNSKDDFTDTSAKESISRILIVDDAAIELEMLTNILTNNDYQVSAATSGIMALTSTQGMMPDLILLDVKMPDMDGYEVCRRLKSDKKNAEIPIIFISALDETDDIVRGFNAGGVDFITKPFQPAEVVARVENHLALRRLQKKMVEQNIQLRKEMNERRQIERSLLEKEAHYRAIVETFDGFIYICSKDYRIEFMNERFIKRTGYDGTGRMCYEVIHDRDSICPWCVNPRVFNGETVRWEVQSPKDNRWMYVVNAPLYHEDGSVSKQSMILDITERKLAEEKLKISEENHRTLVENLNVGVYRNTGGPHGRFIQANPAIVRMFGYDSVDEFMKINVSDLYYDSEDRKSFMESIAQLRSVNNKELRLKKKNGESLWTSVAAKAHYDQNGNIDWIDGVIEDITERKRAEEELKRAHDNLEKLVGDRTEELLRKNRQLIEEIEERRRVEDQLRSSEVKYRNIYENIQDIYYEISLDGIIQEISPSVERITNYKQNELIGKSVYEIYAYPEEREEFLKVIKKAGSVNDYEIAIKDRDGRLYTASLYARLLFDDNGVPEKILGSLRDITKRKRAEEQLRESEKRLSDIIDFLPDAMFAIDRSGKIIAWNRAMEETTGKKSEDMLGKGDYEYALPFYGVRRPKLIDLVFKTDTEVEKEYSFFKKEGDVLVAEVRALVKNETHELWAKASPLYDSNGSVVGAIESIRDITERRTAEKSLKNRERELEIKTRNLEELNTALKVLLKQREDDRNEIEKRTMANVKQLIIPYIEKLKRGGLDAKDMAYLTIVESNLNDIISPFSHGLSTKYMNFTPKELQIAHLIREGKTTKEIAELLNTSPGTIDFHRNNIRNKLNLKNRRSNLRSYLLTLS